MGLLRCKYGALLRHCSLACRVIATWAWDIRQLQQSKAISKLSHSLFDTLFFFFFLASLALTLISLQG